MRRAIGAGRRRRAWACHAVCAFAVWRAGMCADAWSRRRAVHGGGGRWWAATCTDPILQRPLRRGPAGVRTDGRVGDRVGGVRGRRVGLFGLAAQLRVHGRVTGRGGRSRGLGLELEGAQLCGRVRDELLRLRDVVIDGGHGVRVVRRAYEHRRAREDGVEVGRGSLLAASNIRGKCLEQSVAGRC